MSKQLQSSMIPSSQESNKKGFFNVEIWNLQVSQKHKNLDISRTKYYFFFKSKTLITH